MRQGKFIQKILLTFILSATPFLNASSWDVIVPNLQTNKISVVNLSSQNSSLVTVPGDEMLLGKCAITPDGKTAYIARGDRDVIASVIPYDISSGTFGDSIDLQDDDNEGKFPGFIAITPNGKSAYVGCTATHDVWVLDLENHVVAARIVEGLHDVSTPVGIAITPDGKTVYVTDGLNNLVTIDSSTNEVTGSVTVGNSPEAISITPDGKSVLILHKPLRGSNNVRLLTLPNDLSAPIAVDKGANDITVTADGKTAYVVSQTTGTLTPIDIATQTALTPIVVGGSPVGVDITPDDQLIYVAVTNGKVDEGAIVPVDTTTGKNGLPISVGINPSCVAIIPDQAPIAAFEVIIEPKGLDVILDASASSSPVGKIKQYDWDFGDGTQMSTDVPLIEVTYDVFGSYTVTLTVTNTAGTSTTQVFTGQTMTRNGGPSATTSRTINLR